MRIEAFDSTAFGPGHDWVYENMTKEDAVSHLMGLAEIEVLQDGIARKEAIRPTPSGKTEYWVQRRIRGRVVQRLRLWEKKTSEFGKPSILGGIRLPEENKVWQTGQVTVSYDPKGNILEIVAADLVYE